MKMKLGMALVATVLLAGSSGAFAAAKNLTFDGYCDGIIDIRTTDGVNLGIHDIVDGCGYAANGVAVGTTVNIPGMGKYYVFADTVVDAENTGNTLTSTAATYMAIQLPLATGNSWFLYVTTDGKKTSDTNSGTYTYGSAPSATPPGHARKLPSFMKK